MRLLNFAGIQIECSADVTVAAAMCSTDKSNDNIDMTVGDTGMSNNRVRLLHIYHYAPIHQYTREHLRLALRSLGWTTSAPYTMTSGQTATLKDRAHIPNHVRNARAPGSACASGASCGVVSFMSGG